LTFATRHHECAALCPESQYAISELAGLVHPRDGHKKIFMAIEGYLDESGIHEGSLMCVVAGYFGGHGKWKRFETDWRRVLDAFDVPLQEFHAKHLFPKPRGWFQHHWNGDPVALLNALADTIVNHPKIAPIAVGIIVEDFNSFPIEARRYFTGATMRDGEVIDDGCPSKWYFVPFQWCVVRVCEYAPVGGKAHFFFGIDRPFYGYASKLFEQMENGPRRGRVDKWKDRLGMPSAPKAKETPQLQAADFLANLTYHHMLDAGDKLGTIGPPPLLAKCIENRRSPQDFFFMTKANLQDSFTKAVECSINPEMLEQYIRSVEP
jgi:hypothetical protein